MMHGGKEPDLMAENVMRRLGDGGGSDPALDDVGCVRQPTKQHGWAGRGCSVELAPEKRYLE